ncbi:uncharacterized protein LOC116254505 isoform X3 [Nymphaea colorata]|uniref:uncharacterized protein LOC116254505 isoform X3 n=1 Tax=Nymphaea colorata TaxID=210225 RepID=UPI00129D28B0|nr:uncharacterized protein LOC116254505 isoform X3 [Nymphaea colorata]
MYIPPMGMRKADGSGQNQKKELENGTIIGHVFSDLSYTSPVVFVYLLKECYARGTLKATTKFRFLQQQVLKALRNVPQPGPVTFVVKCLYILPLHGHLYAEGFSHLLISSMNRLEAAYKSRSDCSVAKNIAARLFLDILACYVIHEERILVKILESFDVKMEDIGKAFYDYELYDSSLCTVNSFIEQYIIQLVESKSYTTAVSLLEKFSIRQCSQSFLFAMVENKQFRAAEKWAKFMGKPMLCLLIQKYIDMDLLKHAYIMIKTNDLKQEFPDAWRLYKERSIKKLVEKGFWETAEMKTNDDLQLVEYLVYLALESGYSEKVAELCEKYSLDGFQQAAAVTEACPSKARYLCLSDLISMEDVIWVDTVDALLDATTCLEGKKVIGMDCEWRANYVKGSKPNKVSILQIAFDKKVLIFDLLKLSEDGGAVMDDCFKRILHSHRILKLGYNVQCDLHQLTQSYEELECFQSYDMLLDIQKMFKQGSGGLSGLCKKILGSGLNKGRRDSNWNQRPLSPSQIEYAALDAAVLLPLFHHVCSQSESEDMEGKRSKYEWRSCIVSMVSNKKNPKKLP